MSHLLHYARLARVPNVFTALADIALGVLATGSWHAAPLSSLALFAASASLYTGGMVLNDVFDRAEDAKTRPFRPIPSGRVPLRVAVVLGIVLLAAGVVSAALAGWYADDGSYCPGPVGLGAGLVAAILFYDAWLKRTPVGPVGMGLCRFLNVLLGLSAATAVPWGVRLHLAAAVGVYIVGVTMLARTEEGVSRRAALKWAVSVMGAGLVLALTVPARLPAGSTWVAFPYLLAAFVLVLGPKMTAAIRDPGPARVQAAVKWSILGLVALDAVLASALVGPPGLLVLLLLPPGLLLGRWVYST